MVDAAHDAQTPDVPRELGEACVKERQSAGNASVSACAWSLCPRSRTHSPARARRHSQVPVLGSLGSSASTDACATLGYVAAGSAVMAGLPAHLPPSPPFAPSLHPPNTPTHLCSGSTSLPLLWDLCPVADAAPFGPQTLTSPPSSSLILSRMSTLLHSEQASQMWRVQSEVLISPGDLLLTPSSPSHSPTPLCCLFPSPPDSSPSLLTSHLTARSTGSCSKTCSRPFYFSSPRLLPP